MNLQQIKANAPDGATHYHQYNHPIFEPVEYARFVDGVRQIWNNSCNEWIDDIVSEDEQSSDEFHPLFNN